MCLSYFHIYLPLKSDCFVTSLFIPKASLSGHSFRLFSSHGFLSFVSYLLTTTSNSPSTLYCNWASGSGWRRLTSMLTVHPPESWPQILNEPQRSGLPHCPKPTHPLYPHHCLFLCLFKCWYLFYGSNRIEIKNQSPNITKYKILIGNETKWK